MLTVVMRMLFRPKKSALRPPETKMASCRFLNVGEKIQTGGHAAISALVFSAVVSMM